MTSSLHSVSLKNISRPKEGNGAQYRIREHLYKAFLQIVFTASRKRANFKTMPMDVGQPCKPIGLDMRRLGLARKDRQIVDLGNMMKRVATFAKVKYVKYWSCNNK